jgi:hypothetical protein
MATSKKTTTKKTNLFSPELMEFIKQGKQEGEQFDIFINGLSKTKSSDKFPHYYIHSTAGMTKSITIKNLLNNNKIPHKLITGANSIFKFGISCAVYKDEFKNKPVVIYVEDCNLMKNEEWCDILKGILSDERCYVYNKKMQNILNACDEKELIAVNKFIREGEGMKVPVDNFIFVFTSNKKLPTQNEIYKNLDPHLHALRSRFGGNYYDFTLPPTTLWGFITDKIINSPYLSSKITQKLRVDACQFLWDNWANIHGRNVRFVEGMLETALQNPKNYELVWERRFTNKL